MGSDTELKLVDLMRYYVAETESVKELLTRLTPFYVSILHLSGGSKVSTTWTEKIAIMKRQRSRTKMSNILNSVKM